MLTLTCRSCGHTAQRDPDELAEQHLKRGKNPARWLFGPHLKCGKCGAKGPAISGA